MAIENGHDIDVVDKLLDLGADITATYNDKNSPNDGDNAMAFAAKYGLLKIGKALLKWRTNNYFFAEMHINDANDKHDDFVRISVLLFGIFVLKNSTFVIGYQSLPPKKVFGIFFYRGHKQDALQQREIY